MMPNTTAIPGYKVLYLNSTQSSKVDALITACASILFANFPAISSNVVTIVHSLLTSDRGYIALILFKEDECLLGHVVQFLEVYTNQTTDMHS